MESARGRGPVHRTLGRDCYWLGGFSLLLSISFSVTPATGCSNCRQCQTQSKSATGVVPDGVNHTEITDATRRSLQLAARSGSLLTFRYTVSVGSPGHCCSGSVGATVLGYAAALRFSNSRPVCSLFCSHHFWTFSLHAPHHRQRNSREPCPADKPGL